MKQRPEKITSRYSDEYRFELQKVEPTYKDKPGRAVNENKSYARVSKPRFIKDKNNPNFLNVYIDYDLGPGGSSIALGKETMTGQIRRESAAEAMRLAGDIARDLEAEYDLEDIDIQDLENGKVRIFAVSDDFMDMQEKDFNIGESVNEAKTYKKGDKLKIKLKNGKKFDVVFDSYSRTKGVALGKFKDRSGEYDTKPFNLDTIVESVNEELTVNENVSQEVINKVSRFITSMANYYDYSEQDAVYAIMQALRSHKGNFQGLNEIEGEDKIDIITMDVPLFIRILEYSREDAQEDMDLHELTEKAIKATKQQGILQMDDYDMLVGEEVDINEFISPNDREKSPEQAYDRDKFSKLVGKKVVYAGVPGIITHADEYMIKLKDNRGNTKKINYNMFTNQGFIKELLNKIK